MKWILCVVLFFVVLCSAYEGNVHESHPSHEVVTDHWAVELADGIDPDKVAHEHGFINQGPVGTLPNVYLFYKNTATRSVSDHPPIHESPHVLWSENQIAKKRFRRAYAPPSDPLYHNQWHLKNSAGVDVNVEPVWEQGLTGTGVTIAMVDDGLQRTHPDIAPNYCAECSHDYNENDDVPDPHTGDDHGTSAGGVAAAKNNNGVCGSGAAPDARLAGIRLIADFTTDAQEAQGLSFKTDINDIYSNSWGPNDDGRRLERPGQLTRNQMQMAVDTGRKGKGSIYVWAGGNGRSSGDNCNYDGYANSRFTIAIGAVDYQGKQSYYSENCAALIACAPSSGSSKSITTTDLLGASGTANGDCTSTFGGTSAAAPLVAGIVALVLQANPNLGWRDVQDIFVTTSRKNDEHDDGWTVNGAGYHHSHKYGFGLIDATAAVQKARTDPYPYFPKLVNETSAPQVVGKPLNDNSPQQATISISSNFIVETVEIAFWATHSYRGNLRVALHSPNNTESILQEPHADRTANIDGWVYTTVRCWGETSRGDWTLVVEDKVNGNTGTWTKWQLTVYGHNAQ